MSRIGKVAMEQTRQKERLNFWGEKRRDNVKTYLLSGLDEKTEGRPCGLMTMGKKTVWIDNGKEDNMD